MISDAEIKAVMSHLGKLGTGESKRRTAEQCRAAQRESVKAKLRKKQLSHHLQAIGATQALANAADSQH